MKDAIRVVLVDPIDDSARRPSSGCSAGSARSGSPRSAPPTQGAAKRVAEIRPDLVVVTIDSDPDQAVSLIQTIAQNLPGVVVLPASRTATARSSSRSSAPAPASSSRCRPSRTSCSRSSGGSTTAGATRQSDVPRGPQVIAVTAAAGGVGCTTLAVNLATTLAKTSNHEVVLADFDLMLGSLDACLDIIPDHTLQGVVQNIDRLDLTLLKRSMTRHASGLYVLPHPVAMEDAAKIDPELLRRVLVLLKAAFPTVVIDTSKGLQSSDFVAFEMADVILMVVQLDLTCLRNTARLLQLFQQFEGMAERVKLVANRVGSHDSEISLKKAEETLKMPITWQVPNATKVFRLRGRRGSRSTRSRRGARSTSRSWRSPESLRPFPAAETAKARKGLFAAFF